jgi:hypothetical protein
VFGIQPTLLHQRANQGVNATQIDNPALFGVPVVEGEIGVLHGLS